MNSYTFMGLDDVKEGEEISSRKKSFIKRAIAYIKMRRQTFRMARPLFMRPRVTNHSAYFQSNPDCIGREGISPLIKCTSAIRQLAYGVNASFLDEYMQISERSSRKALDSFCQAVMENFGPRSLDCTDWEWFGYPYAFKAQYVRRDHGSNPFILLEAVASQDMWIWHAFFGVVGSNNDINVFSRKKSFIKRVIEYIKTIPEPADDDHRRILYKKKQESAKKDVERAFGVLKKKWAILANPTRALRKDRIVNMMYTCIILHNMIRKYKNYAISPRWFPEEAHQPDDPLRNEEQVQRVMRWIKSSQAHQNLRHDLIEHLAQNA
ncbi:ALP1-like protein [Tanacetum coccineum]